jgi:hypothetical protein
MAFDLGQVIYGIKPNGHLQWYRHDGAYYNGEPVWLAGDGGRKVGEGWNNFETVLHAHSHNTIYGIEFDGDLKWYRHLGARTGTPDWEAGDGGLLVAKGWNRYASVFTGGGKIFYGIEPNGDLYWHSHDGWWDGSNEWSTPESGIKIGVGWNMFKNVFGRGAGFIYGIRYDGALQWYRHLGFNDGSATWTAGNGGLNVGTGWDDFTNVDIGGDGSQGLMYSWHADGTMRWYHHDGWWNGASTWKANSGRTIGGGWGMYAKVFSGDLLSVNL